MAFDASQFMSPTGSEYEITNSLRFDHVAAHKLSFTPPSAGNRKTWTWSGWVKRGYLSNQDNHRQVMMGIKVAANDTQTLEIGWHSDDKFYITTQSAVVQTTQLYRDPSSWYHVIVACNTTLAGATARFKLYVNGVDQSLGELTSVSQNADTGFNQAGVHTIGDGFNDRDLDGYLAEVNFIDGAAKAPADFGETDDNGQWKPIAYAGAYGDEGFYLDFKSSGVGTAGSGTVGADRSGNGNHWTSANLASTDQMLDSPTNNFCVMNTLEKMNNGAVTPSQGNLKFTLADNGMIRGSIMPSSGKWYWEANLISADGSGTGSLGIAESGYIPGAAFDPDAALAGYVYLGNGTTRSHRTTGDQSYGGASYAADDIIGVAYDVDNGTLAFSKNNATFVTAYSSLSGEHGAYFSGYGNTAIWVVNFGQDSSFAGNETAQGNQDGNAIGDFFYAPPSGFLALCTANLAEPAVKPSEYFNTVLWTGNATDDRNITGVGFRPNWSWIKSRATTNDHLLFDSVRGVGKYLRSNSGDAETSNADTLQAFASDGFQIGADSRLNTDDDPVVAWNWKAGTSVSGNSTGAGADLAYAGSVNTDARFSIIKYGGNGNNGHQIPHHLSAVPDAIFIKSLTSQSWNCFFPNTSMGATKGLQLDNTGAQGTVGHLNNTMPSTSVVTLGSGAGSNTRDGDSNPQPYIMYSFKSIPGFSKIGQYIGNGNADSVYVNLGFKPGWIMIKGSSVAENWNILDATRSPNNTGNKERLQANATTTEGATWSCDFVSNGFKIRTTDGEANTNNASYIYMAFAETPFKYSNAR